MAEIDVKFMKGNRELVKAMGNKIKPKKKTGTKKATSKRK